MSSVIKKTTQLTGLVVASNPHYKLERLFVRIMKILQKMPENCVYRQQTEGMIKARTAILKSTSDIATLEKQIGCGQIEEVIVQTEKELNLARNFLGWKPWQPLETTAPKDQWKWPPVK